MIVHLIAIHPFTEGWIMCVENNETHFENVNFSQDCHSPNPHNNLIITSNCRDDLLLDHQDEYYFANKNLQKNILPISEMVFIPEIEKELQNSHYNIINRAEIKPLPLIIKRTVSLLI